MQNQENIHTYDNGFHPKEVKLKDNYKFYRKGIVIRSITRLLVWLVKLIIIIPNFFVWGFKVKGKKNLKKQKGFVLISNHTHPFDVFMILTSIPFKKIYVTTLQSNLGFGIVSKFFRIGGAVPIPEDPKLFKRFNKDTVTTLNQGFNILIYPEAALVPFCDHIREFMPGAFHYAYQANATIIPSVITYHKPRGLRKLFRRKKPCIKYNILPPYHIKDLGNKALTIKETANELNKIMSDYFNEHSDYFKK
ncbi:MAG: 1-acyl-sn-glycerol-3-phosphate acyltransferase [Erysipelotrichaceae bacterium]|nr:1-acyl-sn-glycerol-3-phosphate acyltransferase [Erysipelotrichaceae bacterium]